MIEEPVFLSIRLEQYLKNELLKPNGLLNNIRNDSKLFTLLNIHDYDNLYDKYRKAVVNSKMKYKSVTKEKERLNVIFKAQKKQMMSDTIFWNDEKMQFQLIPFKNSGIDFTEYKKESISDSTLQIEQFRSFLENDVNIFEKTMYHIKNAYIFIKTFFKYDRDDQVYNSYTGRPSRFENVFNGFSMYEYTSLLGEYYKTKHLVNNAENDLQDYLKSTIIDILRIIHNLQTITEECETKLYTLEQKRDEIKGRIVNIKPDTFYSTVKRNSLKRILKSINSSVPKWKAMLASTKTDINSTINTFNIRFRNSFNTNSKTYVKMLNQHEKLSNNFRTLKRKV